MVKTTKPLSDRIKKLRKVARQKTYPKNWMDIYAGSGEVAMSIDPLLSSVFADIICKYTQ